MGAVTADSRYPAHWEADVLLRDGRPAHLRPIRADDADGLVEFHKSLSPETIYYRFFAPYPELSERDIERFTQVDYLDRVALVITQSGLIIGVGRYDRISDHEAEIAFTVREALGWATQGGARALGLASKTGRIEAGYAADLTVLDLRDAVRAQGDAQRVAARHLSRSPGAAGLRA